MDNSELYKECIKHKFSKSVETYTKVFTDENNEFFLSYYEYHNALQTYPHPVIITIANKNYFRETLNVKNPEIFAKIKKMEKVGVF